MNRPKKVNEILEEQINTAVNEYERSNFRLLISAFAAGLEIGFSVFLIAVLFSQFHDQISSPYLHLILSLAYPIGFIFVIIGRSELFTEHTTLAVLPVLNRVSSIMDLLQLWGIILIGNLVGGYIIGLLLTYVAPNLGIIESSSFVYIASEILHHSNLTILGSAIMAGWLMGLLSWLVASAQETISRIFLIIMVTATIGMGGLHHSIVGSIEVFTGMLNSSDINIVDYFRFQSVAIFGNAIGGVFFVAIVKYGQKR